MTVKVSHVKEIFCGTQKFGAFQYTAGEPRVDFEMKEIFFQNLSLLLAIIQNVSDISSSLYFDF
jgi:hypothetical protein